MEASSVLEAVGAGIQLSPNAWSVLAGLGLEESLIAVSSFPERIRMADGISGRSLVDLPLGHRIKSRFGNPYAVVHRGDLQAVLLDKIAEMTDVEVRLSSPVIGYRATQQGVVVELEGRKSESGGLLVGADGVRSALRTLAVGEDTQEFSGKTAWRAMIPAREIGDTSMLQDTHIWLSPDCHLVSYPVRGSSYLNLILILPGTISDSAESPNNHLLNRASLKAPKALDLLACARNWTGWPMYTVRAPIRMTGDKLALIGDAAHAMLPFAAQGAAMAIEDAAVLARCLSGETDAKTALARYQMRRAARVERVMRFARSNGRIYHLPFPLSIARNLGMRMLPASRLMQRQAWIYGWNAPS